VKEAIHLVKCPKCGTEAFTPVKTWALPSRKQGEQPNLTVGIYECSNCKARFRAAVAPQAKMESTASIKSMVERIRDIKGELMLTLKNLREKIETLETERANLMIEIDKLRKVAESRVNALDSEVHTLREQVEDLRDLLGYSERLEK